MSDANIKIEAKFMVYFERIRRRTKGFLNLKKRGKVRFFFF